MSLNLTITTTSPTEGAAQVNWAVEGLMREEGLQCPCPLLVGECAVVKGTRASESESAPGGIVIVQPLSTTGLNSSLQKGLD